MSTGKDHVWLGKPGQMVKAGYGGSLSHTVARRSTVKQTLGGLDKVQWGKRPGREWSVDVNPWEGDYYAGLESLVWGAYGPPPWGFISPYMATTNLVPPGASQFAPGTWSGGGTVLGGFQGADKSWHPVSLAAQTGNVYFGFGSLIVAGQPVTASVYATTGTKFHLHIRDAAANVLSNTSRVAAYDGERVSITVESAPMGAAYARLAVAAANGPGVVAGPSVTLTPKPLPYTWGQGVDAVMVDGLDTTAFHINPGTGSLGSHTYTVKEIRK